jgi:hypothetical protein
MSVFARYCFVLVCNQAAEDATKNAHRLDNAFDAGVKGADFPEALAARPHALTGVAQDIPCALCVGPGVLPQ